MTRAHAGPRASRRLLALLLWSGATALAIGLGLMATPPRLPERAGSGPVFPRIPAPPADARTLLHQLGVGSVTWYAAVIALPFLLWGVRRLDVRPRARTMLFALVVVCLLATGTTVATYLVTYRREPIAGLLILFQTDAAGHTSLASVPPVRYDAPTLPDYLAVTLPQNLLPWIAIAGAVVAIESGRRAVRARVERERLRAEVAEQRLIALSSQLQPHFLFNTLQAISTLIHRDPEAADEMLGKLSELLRDLLRHRDRALVPLGDELRHAQTYLEIAQVRFADRLSFEIDVPPDLHRIPVPLFILQPLVENALAHGIGARLSGGRIILRGRREQDRLHLEVLDDGAGLPPGSAPREGIGMGNTRDRLRASFGADQSFSLAAGAAGGAVARIDIPCRTSAGATT